MKRILASFLSLALAAILLALLFRPGGWLRQTDTEGDDPADISEELPPANVYPDMEKKLESLAIKLGTPQPGEWLYSHEESGQTFTEYLDAKPIRKGRRRNFIALCLVGDFTKEQEQIIDQTKEYMEVFFQVPVRVNKRVSLADIPDKAKRVHPSWGDRQILTDYVLHNVLQPERPSEALAYLAFTASDLWPGDGWNFVFGQASLRQRTGVWSIYRNGNPAQSKAACRQCLIRTLGTASHETGHILTMQHCIAYQCNMNGSNSLPEADTKPLHFCPVCLRKICWNLQVEPAAYLTQLQSFCRKHGLDEEAEWYGQAIASLRNN
jgi:archaemetzincin